MSQFWQRVLGFAAVTAVIAFGGAWVIDIVIEDAGLGRSIWTSAVIAVMVQVGSFVVIWPIVTKNAVAGWGVGSAIRFVAVIVYALVGEKVLGVEGGPALLSLVTFLFASMLVEPLFLKR